MMLHIRGASVQYPNNGKRVLMDCRDNIVKSYKNVVYNYQTYFNTLVRMSIIGDLTFYAPSLNHSSSVEKIYFYEFPCDIHYKYI